MDPLLVIIMLALAARVVVLLLGLFAMGAGGSIDQAVSTPLMWARIGFQSLTLVLLIVAVILHSG
jgi:hypothetical protein